MFLHRKEVEEVQSCTPVCFDVTSKLQRIVEKQVINVILLYCAFFSVSILITQGGFSLLLCKENFDANIMFGNPIKVK